MGAFKSVFEKSDEEKKIVLSPTKGDWITGHADLTGLAVVEVQRLWVRFNQLGCDAKGFLPKKQIEKGELSKEIFIKNVIANLPKEKDGSLCFLVFLKFMQWVEASTVEQKLKFIFHFLNNGDEITKDVLDKLLRKLYPNASSSEIKELIQIFMEELDPLETGQIDEKEFITNIFKAYDEDQLAAILKFDLIPDGVLREANMRPSQPGSQLNMRDSNGSAKKEELDDDTLDAVAKKAAKKDWEKLATKLGYTNADIESARDANNNNNYLAMVGILTDWRDQEPETATRSRLKSVLEECKMSDAAALLK